MFSAYTLKHSAVGVQLTSIKPAATLASSTHIADCLGACVIPNCVMHSAALEKARNGSA